MPPKAAATGTMPAAEGRVSSPVDVVHCFGSCPRNIRENICLLDLRRVAYSVGSRVAITDSQGGAEKLAFLSTGLRVHRISALTCSHDKRCVAVCYKVVDQAHTAYATVYHMPTQPRPSRVKTLSYERRIKNVRAVVGDDKDKDVALADHSPESTNVDRIITSSDAASHTTKSRLLPQALAGSRVEFVTASFSHDTRLLVVLDGQPEWTLLWFEWKSGNRVFTLSLGTPVFRMAFSPLDATKVATAGAGGHFRIWRTQGGKVAPMGATAGLREVIAAGDLCVSQRNAARLESGHDRSS